MLAYCASIPLEAESAELSQPNEKLLDDAVASDELKPCDTHDLARLIQQVNGGAMLDWAVYRKESLAAWLRRSLKGLLAPYRLGAEADLPKARTGRIDRARGRRRGIG